MKAYDFFMSKQVTRLCHFTKMKDVTHIIDSQCGIMSVNRINKEIKNPKDTERYDGELDYICCSIEYPNSWFMRSAKNRDRDLIFDTWIVIYISLDILKYRDVKFSPCNAAKHHGKYIFSDVEKLETLYCHEVLHRIRTPKMISGCPTDDQAEVLIKDNIPYRFIEGFAVADEVSGETLYSILATMNSRKLPIYLAPEILGTGWSNMVRNGCRPTEKKLFADSEES